MEEYKSKVFAFCDEHHSILRIEGGYTMSNIDDVERWVYLGEGTGDRFNLCQTHFIEGSLFEEHGIPLYKVENGEVVRRTDAMIEEDVANIVEHVAEPTQLDRIEAQLLYVAAMTDCLI